MYVFSPSVGAFLTPPLQPPGIWSKQRLPGLILNSLVSQSAIHEVSAVDGLNESLRYWHDHVLVDGKTKDELKTTSSWIDVRDLSEAHVRALKEEKAGGERLIVCAGTMFRLHK
jgi:hypothetical protein